MMRRILAFLFIFLVGLPAVGFAEDALPGKITFRSNRFPYEKVEPMANAGTTIYSDGKLEDKFQHFYSPRWAPNGKTLLGGSGESPPKTVTIADFQSGKFEYIPVEHFTAARAWFPNGKKIAYVGYGGWEGTRRIGPDNIYVYDLGERKLIQEVTHFAEPEREIRGLDISSDGVLLVFDRYSGGLNPIMSVLDLSTGEIKELFRGQGPRFIRGTKKIVYAVVAPDARVIPEGRTYGIFIHDLGSGETKRITNETRYVGMADPCPSPDGRWICYIRDALTGEGGQSVRVIKIDGTGERVIASGDNYAELDWGP